MLSVASPGPRGVACCPILPGRNTNLARCSRAQKRLWAASAAAEAEIGTLHTVQSGETLAQIALAYGVSVEQIQETKPKGARQKRSSLRSGAALKPGQKLIVPSDANKSATQSIAPAHGVVAGAQRFVAQQSPALAACLGGLLLAAAAMRALGTKAAPSAPIAVSSKPDTPSDATASATASAASAPPSQAVTSAVAEVRALLQDAAVEMDAVESALAAVRRAAGVAAAAAPCPGEAVAASAAPAAATVQEVSESSTPPAAASQPAPPATHATAALPAIAPAAATESPAPLSAPTAGAPSDALQPQQKQHTAASPAPVTTDATQAPDLPLSAPGSTASRPAAAAAAPAAKLGSPSSSALADALDTAAQVAAARVRVESAVQAALGLFKRPAPPLSTTAGAPDNAQIPVNSPPPPPLSAADSSATTTPVLDPRPQPLPRAAEALPVVTPELVEAATRPMDAAATDVVLDRIRSINRLLEEKEVVAAEAAATVLPAQPAAAAAAASPAAAAAVVADAVVQDRRRAEGLLGKVGELLSSFESLSSDDEEEPRQSAPAAAPVRAAASATPAVPSVAVAPPQPVALLAAAAGSPSPAGLLDLTTALGGGAATNEVLGRIRDIGRLLDEEPSPPPPPPPPPQQQVQLVSSPAVAAAASAPAVAVPARAQPSATAPPPPPPPPILELPPPPSPLNQGPLPPLPPLQSETRPPPPPLQQTPSQPPSTRRSAVGGGSSPRLDASLLHLKSGLLDLVYGTARGVNASPVTRAAIEEFVTALEARNPNAVPTDAVSAVSGVWKLVYTSHVGTLLLLGALDGLPLVDVGDVVQTINPDTLTATNKIDLAVPMLLSLRAEAGLEVRSPRQFKVRFTRVGLDTYVATPQLTAALELPDSLTVLGATLDLSPLRSLLAPINSGIEAAQGLLGRAVSPELCLDSLPLPPGLSAGAVSEVASLWMLTTYLDDTLRISRDDEGRLFVMLKDVGIDPTASGGRPSRR